MLLNVEAHKRRKEENNLEEAMKIPIEKKEEALDILKYFSSTHFASSQTNLLSTRLHLQMQTPPLK